VAQEHETLARLEHPNEPDFSRDQKLLTLDEINDRFPAVAYGEFKVKREVVGGGGSKAPLISSNESNSIARSQSDYHSVPNAELIHSKSLEDSGNKRTASALDSTAPPENASDGEAQPKGIPTESCAICLEFLEDDDDVRELQCHHYFHQPCIDQWLTVRRGQCPLCKRNCVDSAPQTANSSEGPNIYPSPLSPPIPIPRIYSRFAADPTQDHEIPYLNLPRITRSRHIRAPP
jgi:hypothetical protein